MAVTPSNPLSKFFNSSGQANIFSTTPSVGTNSGALVVTGGVGIGGAVYAAQANFSGSGTNLVTSSTNITIGFYNGNITYISTTTTTAPDGSNTAFKMIETAANNGHYLNHNISTAGTGVWTESIYAKAAERTQAAFSYGPASWATFDISAGTIISWDVNSFSTATITSVGNGWYRLSATARGNLNFGAMQFGLATGGSTTYLGDGSSGIYIWGPQVEPGPVATTYLPTTTPSFSPGSITLKGYSVITDNNAADTLVSGNNSLRFYTNNPNTERLRLSTTGITAFSTTTIQNTTVSTSTNTGALVVQGGVGVWGKLNVGGNAILNQSYNFGTGDSQINGTLAVNGTATHRTLNLQGGNNLLLYSVDVTNGTWSKQQMIASNTGVTAPDGVSTSALLTATAAFSILAQNVSAVAGQVYTQSAFVKYRDQQFMTVTISGLPTTAFIQYDILNGTLSSTGYGMFNNTITAVGNSWYRISSSILSPVTGTLGFSYWIGPYSGSNYAPTGMYFWKPQVELGYAVSAPTDTTSLVAVTANNLNLPNGTLLASAIENSPIGQNTATIASFTSATIRSTSQNLVAYSVPTVAVWNTYTAGGSGSATIIYNTATAPDYSLTAAQVSISAVNASQVAGVFVPINSSGPLPGSTTYTGSLYIRGNSGGEVIWLMLEDNNTFVATSATLTTQWTRYSITANRPPTNNFLGVGGWGNMGYTIGNPGTFFIWGGQVEQGNKAGPYTPTTGSTIFNPASLSFNGTASIVLSNSATITINTNTNIGGNLTVGGYTYYNGLKSAHVFIKGTGLNNNSSNAFYINGNPVNYTLNQRGLTFFTIDKATLTATNYGSYDTYGTVNSSTTLANLLNGMTNTQFGVLLSYDAIEAQINSTLINALAAKGLYKLAYGDHTNSRHPYAALFDAPAYNTIASRNVIEVWESNGSAAPQAIISTYVTTDGTAQGAGLQGNNLTNVLISGEPDTVVPVVSVDQGGGVIITGVTTVTNTTNAVSSLTGALVVSGGVGINKDAWIGGALYFSDGTSQTSAGVGSAIVQLVTLTNKVLPGNFITLPNTATYVVSTGTRVYMDVYVDGYILSKGYDYIESSTTAITTNMALPVGSTLEFRISRAI